MTFGGKRAIRVRKTKLQTVYDSHVASRYKTDNRLVFSRASLAFEVTSSTLSDLQRIRVSSVYMKTELSLFREVKISLTSRIKIRGPRMDPWAVTISNRGVWGFASVNGGIMFSTRHIFKHEFLGNRVEAVRIQFFS